MYAHSRATFLQPLYTALYTFLAGDVSRIPGFGKWPVEPGFEL